MPHALLSWDLPAIRRARRWMLFGVMSLGVAGIFAGLLGGGPSNPYFYTALTEHVDLSVLIWFLTMAAMLFTLVTAEQSWGICADMFFFSFAGGAVLLVLSALTGGTPYMSNYIPVIYHPLFFLGLGLILCGILGTALNVIASKTGKAMNPSHYAVYVAAWIMLIAIACFIRTGCSLPADLHGQVYYEYAFWGGGHVLQFVHTQLMLVCWAWLAQAAGIRLRMGEGMLRLLYSFGLIATLFAAFIYGSYPPISDEYRFAFTLLMKHGGGLAPLVLGGVILFSLVIPAKAGISGQLQQVPAFAGTTLPKICLIMSILLFAVGGAIGYLIHGSNVIVPAHYHGSIIGITLGFMGVCYLLLPAFGYADVSRSKLAFWQPVIYGSGQLCWMVSMAILGEEGVPRKTAGSADTKGAVVSFFKHSADGLALIGGLLFVFIVLKAFYRRSEK